MSKISFDATFEPSPYLRDMLAAYLPPSREFVLNRENGDFVRFTASIGEVTDAETGESAEVNVPLGDVVILERGNRFDRCESD